MGAPCKYRKEHCKIAEDILARGRSLAAVCAQIGIVRSTLYEWRDNNPEFRQAIELGFQRCQAWWEELGIDAFTGSVEKFNAAPWIFTMKNRFREDYAEEREDKKDDNKSVLEKILSGEIKIKHD